jgi:TetR/AcrR family transcriptional repressor of mexJK operon
MATEVLHPHRAQAGGRPTREQAEQRLLRVLQVAQDAFLSAGYADTSLDTIARESGVAKKTLYQHFGDKAGLFAAVLTCLRNAWIAGLQNIVVEDKDPCAVLEAAAQHLLDVGTRTDMLELHRLLLIEARRFPDLIDGHYGRRGGLVGMEPLSAYLRSATQRGLLHFDDEALASEQFVYLVLGGIRSRILRGACRRPNAQMRARIARQAVDIFLHGCTVRGAKARARRP